MSTDYEPGNISALYALFIHHKNVSMSYYILGTVLCLKNTLVNKIIGSYNAWWSERLTNSPRVIHLVTAGEAST